MDDPSAVFPTPTGQPSPQRGEHTENQETTYNRNNVHPEHIRHTKSGRPTRLPSRFAHAVTVGVQLGRMLSTAPSYESLVPLQPLPSLTAIPLEQDMTTSSFLTPPEFSKLRELYYLDSINDPWDPHTAIELILKHRHTRYCRRAPGKHSYSPSVPCITTKGVRIMVQFFDGTTGWIPLEVARVDNPIPLIAYAKRQGLTRHEAWKRTREYDPDALDDLRQGFIAKYESTPHYKFGVQIPTSIHHALRLDKLNGNHLWKEAIKTEMGQLHDYGTFREPTVQDDVSTYHRIPYHKVFDCKFDGRRKGRLVAGGNHTVVPSEEVYTVRTILALTAMDSALHVIEADVGNAFLYGKNKEKTMIRAGPEFGSLQGKLLIVEGGVVRA
jgi:hypothetical protein